MEQGRCPVHPRAKLKRVCRTRDRFWGYEGRFIYGRCPECGSWILDPRPVPQEMGRYYEGYYPARELEAERRMYQQQAESASGGYSKLRAKGTIFFLAGLGVKVNEQTRLLDTGCGLGGFARYFRDQTGVQVRGNEINPTCAAFARDVHGVEVDIGELRDVGYETGQFDIVTSWHCLEHIYDPVAELEEIYRIIRPGGWFQVEVPTPTVLAWIFRGRWFFLQAPTHLYHYRPGALVRLVQDAGFEVKRTFRPWMLSEFAGSLVLLTGLKGFAPKMLMKSRPFRYKLLSTFFHLLMAVDIPVTGLMALLRGGGICRLIAQKT